MILLGLIALFSFQVYSQDFKMERDGLCFQNASEELRRFGPLGVLGASQGVCQGMSGIVSAFKESARFNPQLPLMTRQEAASALNKVISNHKRGIQTKVIIGGFRNLQDFCRSERDLFLQTSITYNADIFLYEITPLLPDFLWMKKSPVKTLAQRQRLHKAILNFRSHLNRGRWPLMLYHSHVVTVLSMKPHADGFLLTVYDSNKLAPYDYFVKYQNGLPAPGQRLIWDITPNRK